MKMDDAISSESVRSDNRMPGADFKTCGECGYECPPEHFFCSNCGTALVEIRNQEEIENDKDGPFEEQKQVDEVLPPYPGFWAKINEFATTELIFWIGLIIVVGILLFGAIIR